MGNDEDIEKREIPQFITYNNHKYDLYQNWMDTYPDLFHAKYTIRVGGEDIMSCEGVKGLFSCTLQDNQMFKYPDLIVDLESENERDNFQEFIATSNLPTTRMTLTKEVGRAEVGRAVEEVRFKTEYGTMKCNNMRRSEDEIMRRLYMCTFKNHENYEEVTPDVRDAEKTLEIFGSRNSQGPRSYGVSDCIGKKKSPPSFY